MPQTAQNVNLALYYLYVAEIPYYTVRYSKPVNAKHHDTQKKLITEMTRERWMREYRQKKVWVAFIRDASDLRNLSIKNKITWQKFGLSWTQSFFYDIMFSVNHVFYLLRWTSIAEKYILAKSFAAI